MPVAFMAVSSLLRLSAPKVMSTATSEQSGSYGVEDEGDEVEEVIADDDEGGAVADDVADELEEGEDEEEDDEAESRTRTKLLKKLPMTYSSRMRGKRMRRARRRRCMTAPSPMVCWVRAVRLLLRRSTSCVRA
jgi:hypothetical protein